MEVSMARRHPTVGLRMGGRAAAATLRQVGIDVQVYEQARQFLRIGAGIQLLPNASRVLRGIGIEERLRKIAFEPYAHLNRVGERVRSSANSRYGKASMAKRVPHTPLAALAVSVGKEREE
jgi:2-polyprenyl-6-methoxyphenol hydroxylase-like FAD-dependent oxidoreductase